MKTKLFFLAAFLLSVCVQGNAQTPAINDVPFKVIASGNLSQITEPKIVVVRDYASWKRLWDEHTGLYPIMPMPEVNFETEMVIAHFLGQTPNCGYNVAVTSIGDNAAFLTAQSQVAIPSGGIYCLMIEQPFEIIKLPRLFRPVVFQQTPVKF